MADNGHLERSRIRGSHVVDLLCSSHVWFSYMSLIWVSSFSKHMRCSHANSRRGIRREVDRIAQILPQKFNWISRLPLLAVQHWTASEIQTLKFRSSNSDSNSEFPSASICLKFSAMSVHSFGSTPEEVASAIRLIRWEAELLEKQLKSHQPERALAGESVRTEESLGAKCAVECKEDWGIR